MAAADELGSYEIKANYRTLGPLFGKEMPLAADAIAALDPAHVADAVRDGGAIGISVGGREHTLTAEDLILTMRAPEGYSVEREGAHAVALDLEIDEDLRQEGRAREIVHAVQNARKNAGLAGRGPHRAGARRRRGAARGRRARTATTSPARRSPSQRASAEDGAGAADYSETASIEGLPLTIGIARASARRPWRPGACEPRRIAPAAHRAAPRLSAGAQAAASAGSSSCSSFFLG